MMAFKQWERVQITDATGQKSDAVAPVIISASRSTDIPAFYAEWLVRRLVAGYVKWVNPFNQKAHYISFAKARAFVFWTKNPLPLIPLLPEFDRRGIGYYFQFTLNDYEKEKLEPGVPPLSERIETFRTLSKMIGKERVIWRFDPLLLSDSLNEDMFIEKLSGIARKLEGFTQKLVFSFCDIEAYGKVRRNLLSDARGWREFDSSEKQSFAEKLAQLGKRLKLRLATCAENIDLSPWGIEHNRCIDDNLLARLFPHDTFLMEFLGRGSGQTSLFSENTGRKLKDKGQRKECHCIVSKDIGSYNTCGHLCRYCYANVSESVVKKTMKDFSVNNDSIAG